MILHIMMWVNKRRLTEMMTGITNCAAAYPGQMRARQLQDNVTRSLRGLRVNVHTLSNGVFARGYTYTVPKMF